MCGLALSLPPGYRTQEGSSRQVPQISADIQQLTQPKSMIRHAHNGVCKCTTRRHTGGAIQKLAVPCHAVHEGATAQRRHVACSDDVRAAPGAAACLAGSPSCRAYPLLFESERNRPAASNCPTMLYQLAPQLRGRLGKASESTQQHALSAQAVPNLTGFNTPARSPVGHTFA